jgi:hypothetical protein
MKLWLHRFVPYMLIGLLGSLLGLLYGFLVLAVEPYCYVDKPGGQSPQCTDNWTLGEPTEPVGNYYILKNGISVQGAKGSKIALCRGSVYVLGRDLKWWKWTGQWLQTGLGKLPCE